MMKIIALAALIACAMAQTKPKPAADFKAEGHLEIRHDDHYAIGDGHWASDTTFKTMGAEAAQFKLKGTRGEIHIEEVARYDLAKEFFVDETHKGCDNQTLSGKAPNPWIWLDQASYTGTRVFRHQTYELWTARIAGSHTTLGVHKTQPDTPVFIEKRSGEASELIVINKWHAGKPTDTNVFNIPTVCV